MSAMENQAKLAPDPDNLSRTRAFATNDIRIDWFRILMRLKAEGYSHSAISHFTGISTGSICGYKAGGQPIYHHGVRLLQFWSETTGLEISAAPTISPYSFKA